MDYIWVGKKNGTGITLVALTVLFYYKKFKKKKKQFYFKILLSHGFCFFFK